MYMKTASAISRLALLAILVATPASAADGIYMETNPQIEGDSITNGFIDQIELSSIQFGGFNDACSGGKGGAVTGELSISKLTDQATVDLLQALKNQSQYTITISMTRNAGSPTPATYQQYVLTNAIISSYAGSDGGGGGGGAESLTISYSSIEIIYSIYDNMGVLQGTESVVFTPSACVN